MARIPLDSFDMPRVSPQPRQSSVDLSGSLNAGRALERAGQTLTAIGERGMQIEDSRIRHEEAQAAQEADALNRVRAANALADRRIQIAAAQQDFTARMAAGEVDYRGAESGWQEAIARLPPVTPPDGLDPVLAETFNGGLRQIDEEARLKITGLAQVAQRADFKAQAVAATSKNEQLAAMTGDTETAVRNNAALAAVWKAAGFDAAETEKALAASNERIYSNEVKARLLAGRDSLEQLQALQSDLTGDKGRYLEALPADKRLALASSVATEIDQLQRAQQTAADKRETVAENAVKEAVSQAAAGIPPTPDTVEAWSQAVAGTSQEAPFREALGTIREVQAVRRMPGPAQQTWLQEQETRLNTQGGTPQDLTRLNTVRAALARDAEQRETAPLLYLQNMTGNAPAPLDMAALAGGDVSAFGRALADRLASVQTLRKQGYNAKLNLLLPNEAEALTGTIKQLNGDQLLKLFGPLRAAAGSEQAYTAVMQQVAPGAPLKAYAGELAIRPGGQPVASLLLRGEALLAGKGDKAWPMPASSGFEQAFVEIAGDAYQGRPDAMQRDLAAARAVYAASAAQDGDTLAGTEFNPERFANSMRAVIGDVAEIGGVRVPSPWGMDADTFAAQAAAPMREALQAAGLDPDAAGVGLMATPLPGRYVLVQGRSPVWNPNSIRADGRPMPVFIDFKPQPPPTTPAKLHLPAVEATLRGTR